MVMAALLLVGCEGFRVPDFQLCPDEEANKKKIEELFLKCLDKSDGDDDDAQTVEACHIAAVRIVC